MAALVLLLLLATFSLQCVPPNHKSVRKTLQFALSPSNPPDSAGDSAAVPGCVVFSADGPDSRPDPRVAGRSKSRRENRCRHPKWLIELTTWSLSRQWCLTKVSNLTTDLHLTAVTRRHYRLVRRRPGPKGLPNSSKSAATFSDGIDARRDQVGRSVKDTAGNQVAIVEFAGSYVGKMSKSSRSRRASKRKPFEAHDHGSHGSDGKGATHAEPSMSPPPKDSARLTVGASSSGGTVQRCRQRRLGRAEMWSVSGVASGRRNWTLFMAMRLARAKSAPKYLRSWSTPTLTANPAKHRRDAVSTQSKIPRTLAGVEPPSEVYGNRHALPIAAAQNVSALTALDCKPMSGVSASSRWMQPG